MAFSQIPCSAQDSRRDGPVAFGGCDRIQDVDFQGDAGCNHSGYDLGESPITCNHSGYDSWESPLTCTHSGCQRGESPLPGNHSGRQVKESPLTRHDSRWQPAESSLPHNHCRRGLGESPLPCNHSGHEVPEPPFHGNHSGCAQGHRMPANRNTGFRACAPCGHPCPPRLGTQAGCPPAAQPGWLCSDSPSAPDTLFQIVERAFSHGEPGCGPGCGRASAAPGPRQHRRLSHPAPHACAELG